MAKFPLNTPFLPMEAFTSSTFPTGSGWLYEPKWDGFRCLIFREGDKIELQSKAGKTLSRYFPEVLSAVSKLASQSFVLDSELVISFAGELNFDMLLQRIHPAASRIAKLAAETPAHIIAFDLLAEGKTVLVDSPLKERRVALERFAKGNFKAANKFFSLSPAVTKYSDTERWLKVAGSALDGLIAKELDEPYRSGERKGMQKLKFKRTADCVVGGFRQGKRAGVGSLLLGLYDGEGLLHHVGFTSSILDKDRKELTEKLVKLKADKSFTGKAPGGPSRWSKGESTKWEPVKPKLVCEVEYDHFTGGRFRHGTKFLRWRPDKPASKCTMAQVHKENSAVLLKGKI